MNGYLIEAVDLRLSLPDRSRRGLFRRRPMLDILKGVDFHVAAGESVGIVGESGSGKTTLGRSLIRLYEPTGGRLLFDGTDITSTSQAQLRPLRPRMQMIFQDPMSSLNPRHRVGGIVAQPLRVSRRAESAAEIRNKAIEALERAGLSAAIIDRYPHQLSGGQRQRVGIARAIVLNPDFIVADEIVSGLDVSTQTQILDLLRHLKKELNLALAFITHDLSVVRVLCDRVVVMHLGEIVEEGPVGDVFASPKHAYTRTLIDAIPLPEIDRDWLDRS